MATFRYTVQIASRAKRANTVAMSAYITGQTLRDKRSKVTRSCPDKTNVIAHKIFVPEDAPDWAFSSEGLWTNLEYFENRYDAQLCRNIKAGIPAELNEEQIIALGFAFAAWLSKTNGTAVEAAIRKGSELDALGEPKPEDAPGFYLQMMESLRVLGKDGFGEKAISQKVFKLKAAIIESKRRLEAEREHWTAMANAALTELGLQPKLPSDPTNVRYPDIPRGVMLKNRLGQSSPWMERFNREQQQAALDRELEELNAEVAELDLAIEQKTREKNENERIRTAALAALAADVRTTGGHLEESARLSAADGYFDRRLEQAAATEHARRAGQILGATGAVFAGAHGETGLAPLPSLLSAASTSTRLALRSKARVEGWQNVRDTLRLADQALAALPIDQAIVPRSFSRFSPSIQTRITRALDTLRTITGRLETRLNSRHTLDDMPSDVIDLAWLTSTTPTLETSELAALLDGAPTAFLESATKEASQIEQWQNRLIQKMGHPPEAMLLRGVFIGRVLSCCPGAFAQGLGFDGQYVIHQTEHTLEEGDVVRVEMRSGVPSVEVKHRAPR